MASKRQVLSIGLKCPNCKYHVLTDNFEAYHQQALCGEVLWIEWWCGNCDSRNYTSAKPGPRRDSRTGPQLWRFTKKSRVDGE